MGDDYSIHSQWGSLLPAEKVGNCRESLVGQVEKEIPQQRKRRRKGQDAKSDTDQEKGGGVEGTSKDPEVESGKIVDITI